jgi:hypothetical protein
VKAKAEGWYHDPYALHEDRWFSLGTPTKLVRDDGQETYDEPPATPLPESELVPADSAGPEDSHGTDLRRADAACDDSPYSAEVARRAAFDVWNIGWPI